VHAEVDQYIYIYKSNGMWQSVFGAQMVMFLCIRLPMNSKSMVMVVILEFSYLSKVKGRVYAGR